MPLFNGYFDPNSYAGTSGLFGRLLAGANFQLPASQGFDPARQDVADYGQTSNIPIGNYLMPAFGTPDPAQLPTNAQPAAGQLPMGQGVQMPAQSPSFLQSAGGNDIGGHLMAGLQNFANSGGILPAIANGISGLVTGQRTDEAGLRQQSLRAQYAALVPLLGPQKAMLAVVSPEAAKTLIPQALSNKARFTKIGQDSLGRETYGFVDENNQTVNGKEYQPQAAGAEGDPLGNTNLTGKEYLATLPKAQANTVQMMVEGKLAPPTSFAMTKPYWQNMIAAAKNYDPTFDATAWAGRVAGVVDFSKGKSSEMVRSANQTIGHVGDLIDKMDALHNKQSPGYNAVGNYINSNILGQKGVIGFQQNAHAVADELSKVFKGAGISDHEIKQWEQNLSPNMSPEQQKESISTMLGLLEHSLSALEEKRLNSIGPLAAEKAGPLLNTHSQEVLARAKKWASDNGADTSSDETPKSLKAGESANVGGVTIKRIK